MPDDLAAQFDKALRPTTVEIARAKGLILDRLWRGGAELIDLEQVLHTADGLPTEQPRHAPMELTGVAAIDPNDEHIRIERNRLAAKTALAELVSEGLVNTQEDTVGNSQVSVPVHRAGTSWGQQSRQAAPKVFGRSAVLARRLVDNPDLVVLDPDVFSSGIDGIGLDPRTRRCLEEALAAYRRGLYLASVSLLGAVSEGAWYAASERLRGLNDQLDRALDGDATAARIQDRACDVLRQHQVPRATVTDLQATAGRLRDLRNYGVHPRSAEHDSQERFFTEHGSGLLLLDAQRYLTQLAAAVEAALAHAASSTG